MDLVQSVMSTPRRFEDSNGRIHVAYDLSLTNGFPVRVRVTEGHADRRPRCRAAADVKTPSGSDLTASMAVMASPTEPARRVPGLGIGGVWFDIIMPDQDRLPRMIGHTLTVPTRVTARRAFASVDRRPSVFVTIGPPLCGPGCVAVGSCSDGPHRRSIQPVNGARHLGQRFAVDWNGMDAHNRFVVGVPDLNPSWTFYGKPVVAVPTAPS